MSKARYPVTAVMALFMSAACASAVVVPFTETFATNASGWLTGASTVPTWNATGGVGDSSYISYTSTFTSGSSGPFGSPPLQVLFRGNNSADASGDAFVGNWLGGGVTSLNLAVRHNYTETLSFYARLDAGSGAAASLAFNAVFAIQPNTWTLISIPITNSNPPFLSFGAGTFNTVFSNMQNLQFGLYLPADTTFTDLRMDIDNVSVVPEPATSLFVVMGALGAGFAAWRRRRPTKS